MGALVTWSLVISVWTLCRGGKQSHLYPVSIFALESRFLSKKKKKTKKQKTNMFFGSELGSSGRTASTLNHSAISPAAEVINFFVVVVGFF
jgi:hypothetical protein